MTKLEQDQEGGNQWSRLLDFDSFFCPTSYCVDNNNQSNDYIHQGQCLGEYHYDDRDCSHIDNNELNQEQSIQEFSRLTITDSSHVEENQLHIPCIPSDWTNSSYTNCWPGTRKLTCVFSISVFFHYSFLFTTLFLGSLAEEGYMEEADSNEPSSSCSSTGEISYDGEDHSQDLEVMDDSSLDGELGKRINQMVPLPHVPKINGEIPSFDEATSDHQRLLDRLQLYDLVERKVQGDGNCQFHSLSDQFYRTPAHHKFVRQQVVDQLISDRGDYEGYVPMEYDQYLEKMSKEGEWGDHVTLQAAADSYGVKIFVITSFKDTCYIEIVPKAEKSKRVIFLSFWAEVHYNSIYPRGGKDTVFFFSSDNTQPSPPHQVKTEKKKRWWRFGRKH